MKSRPWTQIDHATFVPRVDAAIQSLVSSAPVSQTLPKRVLLLQGPVGPFFTRLQATLSSQNVDAWRVCFHAGDRLFCSGKNNLLFDGPLDEWANWLRQVLAFGDFGTIVLFGSERPAHVIARTIAAETNIDIISLEEGYIRPGFVTVETGGNNASSPLAGQIKSRPPNTPTSKASGRHFNGLKRMIAYGAVYYTVRNLLTHGQRRALFHRQTPLLQEAFCWSRNLARRVCCGDRNFAKIQHLLEHCDKGFYLVPLQVSADANLINFSNGWHSIRMIQESIRSFALHAPPKTRLVFKVHPMERGHNGLTPQIKRNAAACGVADQVDVIETGSLGLLTRHSAGMITINSSSGLSAIFHGVPLMVLGRAVYANDTLATTTPDFDAFWTAHHVASPEVRAAYIAWIKQEALMPGDFYCNIGMDIAAQSILQKLQTVDPATPLMTSDVIPMKVAS